MIGLVKCQFVSTQHNLTVNNADHTKIAFQFVLNEHSILKFILMQPM